MRLSWFLRSALRRLQIITTQSPSASGSAAFTPTTPLLSISILFFFLVGSSQFLKVVASGPPLAMEVSSRSRTVGNSIMNGNFKIHLPTDGDDDYGNGHDLGSTLQGRYNEFDPNRENSSRIIRSCGVRELWPWPWPRRKRRSTNNELWIPNSFDENGHPRKLYKWNKKYITYRVSQYTKQPISHEKIDKDLATAFKLWEEHVNLRFVRSTRKDSEVDIDIRFVMGEHGDHNPFTGDMAETLGHAFPPMAGLGGDVHFNDNFTWSEGTTFLHTATHEIGHALGLHHNFKVRTAIMSPYQGDSSCPVVLGPDDIRQVQAIYGPKDPPLPWSQYARKAAAQEKDRATEISATTAETTLEISTTTVAPATATTSVQFWPWQSTNRNKSRATEALAPFPTFSTLPLPKATNFPKNVTTTTATVTTATLVSTTTANDIPIPTTTKNSPSLVETAIEATVLAKTETRESQSPVTEPPTIIINPSTELWTKILQTVLIPNVTTRARALESQLDEETTTTTSLKFDLESKSQPSSVLVTATTPTDEDKIYFCDSNELCSKKELEENLTEDILALGSGNFELSDDSEPDSSPNLIKTDNSVTASITSDLFLPEGPENNGTPKPGENLTVKSSDRDRDRDAMSINGASGNQQHWLTMLDIIIRSVWILIVMFILSPSYYLSHMFTFEL